MKRQWTFNVNCRTYPGEVVCVTGSCNELGNWKQDKVQIMSAEGDPKICSGFGGETERTWTLTLELPKGADITFRYCISCVIENPTHSGIKQIIARRWETSLMPRIIACHDICDATAIANFGYFDNDASVIQRAWITKETIVQLKLFGEKALNIWRKKHNGKDFFIKVTPVKANKSNMEDSTMHTSCSDDSQSMDLIATRDRWQQWPIVEVAKLNDDDCEFRMQSQFGVAYEKDGFIMFQAQVLELPTVSFLVDIFARPSRPSTISPSAGRYSHEPAELIGSCYIMPKHFTSTVGRIEEAIISSTKFEAIGEIKMDFLVIQSVEDANCDYAVTFAKHWQPHWKGIDVGHRGLGNSFTKLGHCSHLRENTIASLKYAYSHGADMVEFDVQLSKDKIPVIYHDFELCTTSVAKTGEKKELIPMQLKNLTLAQLRRLKIHHHSEMTNGAKEFIEEDDEEHQPFPTLEEALNLIDQDCGFNIEVKWDMMLKDGSNECHFPFEINLFLDQIIKTALAHGSSRKIVFSSFNPDVCTMLRLKQNRYPVLLLTQGINSKYEDYLDPRTWTVKNGSNFAAMADILGVSAMAEDIKRDPGQVSFVKDRGQVMFVWTDDQNDSGTVKYLKELGVDGIIYDRMDVNNSKDVKAGIFGCFQEREVEKMARSPKSGCSCDSPESSPPREDSEEHRNEKLQGNIENAAKEKTEKSSSSLNSFLGVLLAKS